MFSRSTFQRYLFDISGRQKQTRSVYAAVLESTSDPALRKELTEFLDQLEAEEQTIGDVQRALQEAT